MCEETIRTPLTELLGIQKPIILAGMNAVAHSRLVAAVSNAGGLGVIGGLTLTPKILRKEISKVKENLVDKSLPFGVDLAIPQVGGNARKTNHDYTHGKLPELVDVMIQEKCSLFVCAVGVPPKWLVDKLHAAKIPIMNMIGHPKHVIKALDAGVDLICAQGSEGGGHTGEIATSLLVPQVVDICKGRISPLGFPVHVVAAGGIFDGRGLAASLSFGAQAVWVGTRFIAASESAAPPRHREGVLSASSSDTTKTLLYTGRPLRVLNTEYIKSWDTKTNEVQQLCLQGKIPFQHAVEEAKKADKLDEFDVFAKLPLLMGQACGPITKVEPAKTIIDNMMTDAIRILKAGPNLVHTPSRL
mmetsp:Transcript_35628/g.69912  ORF Transcript_35628/g.69912 Transcript_35628/m.69912 type:complete len:358 (+) Transcript_35628:40-1113(+)